MSKPTLFQMEHKKKRFQKVGEFSRIKFFHFSEILKEKTSAAELAQRDIIPEYPLILLHGYWNGPKAWKKFVPFFEANRYVKGKNLFLFDGRGENESPAIIDIRINAKKLQDLVQHVLALSGSSKVNLLAHSMGGLISRWYIEQLRGSANVHKLIMMGTPNHGSRYLPIITRIVNFIDKKLEGFEINKQKFDQLRDQNVLHKHIQEARLKHQQKKISEEISPLVNQNYDYSSEHTEPMKITLNSFDKMEEENIEKHIQQITNEVDIDHLGMAAIQMDLGSEFLTTLGYKGQTNYFLIMGTKGFPEDSGLLPKGPNDGAVHTDSVDLTDVPNSHKVMFKVTHFQLRNKIVVFNQIMSFLLLE